MKQNEKKSPDDFWADVKEDFYRKKPEEVSPEAGEEEIPDEDYVPEEVHKGVSYQLSAIEEEVEMYKLMEARLVGKNEDLDSDRADLVDIAKGFGRICESYESTITNLRKVMEGDNNE